MIRGHGFLKYLKLFSIGFGISFFMGLGVNSVSALGVSTEVGLESFNSPVNSNYSVTPLKGGAFLTNYLGVGKSVLALDNNILFWRTTNGYPYAYLDGDRYVEGFFDSYYSCDLMTGAGSPSNCSKTNITYDLTGNTADFDSQVFKSFFKTVVAGQRVYIANDHDYYHGATYQYSYNFITVCWNSEDIGKSFCFKGGGCTSNGPSLCNNYGRLVNSENLRSQFNNNFNFGLLSNNWIGYAPGQNGYMLSGDIEGGNQTFIDSSVTGNVIEGSCSKNLALSWYRCNGYKSRMCYSSYLNNSEIFTGSPVGGFALTGTDILDVRFDTRDYRRYGQTGDSMSYDQWFAYWRKTWEVYKNNPGIDNPFNGVPVSLFTLMGNIEAYGMPYTNESILEFCDLSLYTANLQAQYTGVASAGVCSMSAIDVLSCDLSNSQNGDDGYPGYGDTTPPVLGSSWDGITNRPGYHTVPGGGTGYSGTGLSSYTDGKTFQNNYFNVLTQSFKYPSGGSTNPILPSFIVITMCGLIFFRFLSH